MVTPLAFLVAYVTTARPYDGKLVVQQKSIAHLHKKMIDETSDA